MSEANIIHRTPNILTETAAGYSAIPICDELFRNREIECVGTIDRDMTYSLCQQLRYLHRADPQGEITLYINSPGGEIRSGLAIYDVMQAISCPIRTVCVGTAASMGAILFMSGDTREMLEHAQVMIHDPIVVNPRSGPALEIQSLAEDIMQTREFMAQIIAKHTGKSLEEVLETTAHDAYFDAESAIEWGLADRVIREL